MQLADAEITALLKSLWRRNNANNGASDHAAHSLLHDNSFST